jgi:hypothetical protein
MSIRASGPETHRDRYDGKSRNLHPLLPRVTSSSTFTTLHLSFVPQSTSLPMTSSARTSQSSLNYIPEIVSPPLPRRQCIPLPQLSYVETQINRLLVNGIDYNVRAPTSFAACPSRRHSSRGRDAWKDERAVHPTVPFLKIYLDFDPHRPIVIFPTHRNVVFPTHNNYGASITIAHVLAAVNRRVTAIEDELQQAYYAGYSVQLLPREVYWAGLVQSSTESDAWVLRTD